MMPIKMMLTSIILGFMSIKIKYVNLIKSMYSSVNMMFMNNFYLNIYKLPMKLTLEYNNKFEKMILDSLSNKLEMMIYFYVKNFKLSLISPNNFITSLTIFMLIMFTMS